MGRLRDAGGSGQRDEIEACGRWRSPVNRHACVNSFLNLPPMMGTISSSLSARTTKRRTAL